VTDYRLYFLDATGHIQSVEELTCIGDDAAVQAARDRADGRAMELWQRDRRLGAFAGEVSTSEPHAAKP
jgi:hypothetical protein